MKPCVAFSLSRFFACFAGLLILSAPSAFPLSITPGPVSNITRTAAVPYASAVTNGTGTGIWQNMPSVYFNTAGSLNQYLLTNNYTNTSGQISVFFAGQLAATPTSTMGALGFASGSNPDYSGTADYSGVFVFDNKNTVRVGDRVTLTAAGTVSTAPAGQG